MRADMHKVIIERPRYGGGRKTPAGYKKRLQNQDWEDAPKRESMRRPWKAGWAGKVQSDLLGPLRKFLRSRVGHLWNDVYSELCEKIDKRNVVQEHLLSHVRWEVAIQVTEIDGKLHNADRVWWPLQEGCLYVCPETGLLKQFVVLREPAKSPVPSVIRINDHSQYRKIDRHWFQVTVEVSDHSRGQQFLPKLPLETVSEWNRWGHVSTWSRYEANMRDNQQFRLVKRQLNSREVRRLLKQHPELSLTKTT